MTLFIILFLILGAIEVYLKPRLHVTELYYIIWYSSNKKRDFIKFSKTF